jgi:hypothetical protein
LNQQQIVVVAERFIWQGGTLAGVPVHYGAGIRMID